jgi:hypothetical protein
VFESPKRHHLSNGTFPKQDHRQAAKRIWPWADNRCARLAMIIAAVRSLNLPGFFAQA